MTGLVHLAELSPEDDRRKVALKDVTECKTSDLTKPFEPSWVERRGSADIDCRDPVNHDHSIDIEVDSFVMELLHGGSGNRHRITVIAIL